jgi:hypothetical protein
VIVYVPDLAYIYVGGVRDTDSPKKRVHRGWLLVSMCSAVVSAELSDMLVMTSRIKPLGAGYALIRENSSWQNCSRRW